jgi:hypothetical protein
VVKKWRESTAEDMQRTYNAALQMFNTPRMKTAAERLLKNNGMRFVKVSSTS